MGLLTEMESKKEFLHGFIESWSPVTVRCVFPLLNQRREFTDNASFVKSRNLFEGYELFKGKEVIFETEIVPGCMTTICHEVKKSKLKQKFNYWFYRLKMWFKHG